MKPKQAQLVNKLEAKSLTSDEVIKILKGIDRRENLKTHVAFFGYSIRLHRLNKNPNDVEELNLTQQFLASAFRIYYNH